MVRADDLATTRDTARVFVRSGSPRVIIALVVAVVAARLVIADWSWTDLLVVLTTALFVGPVEWVLHRTLLHAERTSWTSRHLGTGAGHRQHHLDPGSLDWLLLRAGDVVVFAVLIAAGTITWTLAVSRGVHALFGWESLLGPAVTGIAAAYLALAHYEWTHLLVHTRHRSTTRLYRRLQRNHRLHHYRNERYWLGITSNLGDRVFRTCPGDKRDVPLSETARTLSTH